ncbi:MAG: phosphoenolpyruvate--protein phosphotransferase [Deltaproteobacteria bacterium]|nr:phosphoenolpyruvate--protein phosphotransferase [Deltaproteobacteria bacterium]MCL5792114.1 phosphoenolpyruvate--protein phosphotransferase [Deltaproteobacteria bacterium]
MTTYLKGIGVSPGWATGKAIIPIANNFAISRYHVMADRIPYEVNRFISAIEKSKEELNSFKNKINTEIGKEAKLILDTHILILEDKGLIENIVSKIKNSRMNTEWALTEVLVEIEKTFNGIDDEYLKERKFDIIHEGQRVLKHLTERERKIEPEETGILVITEFAMSNSSFLMKEDIRAVALELGGLASHTTIIARSLGIPAVAGIKNLSEKIKDGDMLLLDGNNGILIIDPESETLYKYKTASIPSVSTIQKDIKMGVKTVDDVPIKVMANIEFPEEAEYAKNKGADGIGLFRTEYLYISKKELPTEDQSYSEYSSIVKLFHGSTIIIRTLDTGGDKLLSTQYKKTQNPALGLRGIRLCLKEKELLKTQLRGILRASEFGETSILLPMITSTEEAIEVKQLIEDTRSNLISQGYKLGTVKIGALIETPAASIIINELLDILDFASVGTNDLIQYTLATDRSDNDVIYLYQPLHPAVIRILASIATAAENHGKPAQICGEMANTPLYIPLLLGMGYSALSMDKTSIQRIKRLISRINMEKSKNIAKKAITLGSQSEVEQLILKSFKEELSYET